MELKEIPFNKAYQINDSGTIIISKRTGKLIKASEQLINGKPSGYLYATLCNDMQGENYVTILPKRIAVHRLVALTWLPDPPTSKHIWVNHKDGNKANNHYSNLEWTTISENIQHTFDVLGRKIPKGKDHWMHGKKHSLSVKAKMSQQKQGEKHPMFKGYYYINGIKYTSLRQASLGTGYCSKFIKRQIDNKVKGFDFVPKV